jgi:hypothetical protein
VVGRTTAGFSCFARGVAHRIVVVVLLNVNKRVYDYR